MNKKVYIAPELQQVLVQPQQMIAASGEQTISVSDEEVTSGFADSRSHFSLWDDDEEE